ncbi:hypothetical protein [Winogradskyella sp. SM1960]|uniref:hypothetical protein n=1 Tax=Winogradskyella sp. SM1960 TaxID=2865955 RepID=UPI001CD6335B|nr:hypothetical protein [Winogradskyella sp. SM1960]
MKSQRFQLLTLVLIFIFIACSPEDNTNTAPEDINEFVFNGNSYPLLSAIISNDNSSNTTEIRLFNKTSSDITSNSDLTDVDFVHFNIHTESLQNTTYNNFEDYNVSINGSVIDSEFNSGTILLASDNPELDSYAESGSLSITNFTPYNIVFTFTFTRNDGDVITGRYDGNYYAP